ncbi:hypothetical protein SEA_FUZZBUSTER_17 [Microbacterium phage FuzzBuster]|uniref:Uncharacterized protein n=1 Tax=Microbacterium phage FuzzBuster TaxID=2590935 RepID=A0A516KUZ5_9CAUD|nr:hypothetical protein SEA_FUZZBUSTER_17 [Microbacterium phage FuzzBuster]
MRTITTRFDEVTRRRVVQGKCSVCGKRTTRTLAVTNTVNPFNKNADGTIKTRDEVAADVSRQLGEMVADFDHAKCKAA